MAPQYSDREHGGRDWGMVKPLRPITLLLSLTRFIKANNTATASLVPPPPRPPTNSKGTVRVRESVFCFYFRLFWVSY